MARKEFYFVTKQEAAARQIHAAMALFHGEEYECAVTLAGAAEGLVPASDRPHAFSIMRAHPISKEVDFNEVVNWLKHPVAPDTYCVSEFEAAMLIVRVISKFISVYRGGPPEMQDFTKWAFDTGLLPSGENSN